PPERNVSLMSILAETVPNSGFFASGLTLSANTLLGGCLFPAVRAASNVSPSYRNTGTPATGHYYAGARVVSLLLGRRLGLNQADRSSTGEPSKAEPDRDEQSGSKSNSHTLVHPSASAAECRLPRNGARERPLYGQVL